MTLKKFAAMDILDATLAPTSSSALRSYAHKHAFAYQPRPGYLYVRSRAISSRTNDNFDNFPAEEIEAAYASFVGKPVFVNHNNDNHRRARGVIIDSALHKDTNPDGSPDTWAEVLMEVDALRFPKLAQAILAGHIDRTSMGTDVAFSKCSFCGNKASTPLEYCQHIPKMKGQRIYRTTASGKKEGVLVAEICHGLKFFENSLLVEEPADPTAHVLGEIVSGDDVTPRTTRADAGDGRSRHAVASANLDQRELTRPGSTLPGRHEGQKVALDGEHIGLGQDAARVRAAWQAAPSLHHVAGVLPVGAQHPVGGVVAEGGVAGVAHDQAVRDGADQGLVAPSVRAHAAARSVVQGQSAVPVREGAARPGPATAGTGAGIDLGQVASKYAHEGQRTTANPYDPELAARQRAHWDKQQSFRDRGLCDCAGSMKIEPHKSSEHSDWATKAEAEGKTDGWGTPIMQPYDGHGAWSCNNRSCAEHPQALYEQQPGRMPGWLEHEHDPHKDITREVGKHFYEQGMHEDGRYLLDQQHDGPSHLSSRTAKTAGRYTPGDEDRPVYRVGDAVQIENGSGGQRNPALSNAGIIHKVEPGKTRWDHQYHVTLGPPGWNHPENWSTGDGPDWKPGTRGEGNVTPLNSSTVAGQHELRPAYYAGDRQAQEADPSSIYAREIQHQHDRDHSLAEQAGTKPPHHTFQQQAPTRRWFQRGPAEQAAPEQLPSNVVPLRPRAQVVRVAKPSGSNSGESTPTKGVETGTCHACGKPIYKVKNSAQGGWQHDIDGAAGVPHQARPAGKKKSGLTPALAYGEQVAPADVDTLRDEECPVCGENDAYDGNECQVCGFVAPPKMFQDPDLDVAKQLDLRKDIYDETNADPNGDGMPDVIPGSGTPGSDEMPMDANEIPDPDDVAQQQVNQITDEQQPLQPEELDENGQPVQQANPLDPQAPQDPNAEPINPEDIAGNDEQATEQDGQQPAQQDGEPGTAGDGVADLVCPVCGFEADATPPQSVSMDTPDAGAGEMAEGSVCPNCGKGQLVSVKQAEESQAQQPPPDPRQASLFPVVTA